MVNLGRYLLNSPCILPITILCALSSLFFLPGLFVASVIMVLYTLEHGYRAGSKLLLGVIAPFCALMLWDKVSILFILFFLFRYSLTWLMAGLYRRYGSWRLELEVFILLGMLAVIIFHLNIPNVVAWWTHIISHQSANFNSFFSDPMSTIRIKQQLLKYADMGTGLAMVFVFMDCSLYILLGEYWRKKINQKTKGEKTYDTTIPLKMGPIFSGVLLLIFIGKLLNLSLAIDCLPIILFPFVITGLYILHTLAHKHRFFKWGMILVYIGLALGFPWLIFLLAAIAFIDSINLQKCYQIMSLKI